MKLNYDYKLRNYERKSRHICYMSFVNVMWNYNESQLTSNRLAKQRVATQSSETEVISVIYKEFLQMKKEIPAEKCAKK